MTHIVVTAKLVPDLVEELEIADSGTALDMTWLRLIINEFDDHAIEQAILLKEKFGGQVTIVAPDMEGWTMYYSPRRPKEPTVLSN